MNPLNSPALEAQIIFWRQLAVLLKSGIPLYRSLGLIYMETREPRMRKILEQALRELKEGKSLSKSFEESNGFHEWVISLVNAGEKRGALDEAAIRVTELYMKKRDLQQKLSQALSYPILLLICGTAIMTGMLIYVVPRFKTFFVETQMKVPGSTSFLFKLSDMLTGQPLILLGILISIAAAVFILIKTDEGKKIWDRVFFYIPGIGPIGIRMATAQFARFLGMLYISGIPLLQAMVLARDSQGNRYIREDINRAINSAREGHGIAETLSHSSYFPKMLSQMLMIGEESGQLGQMAIRSAEFFEEDAEFQMKKYLALLEPLSLIVIALGVAWMASAMMLPLFNVASSIRMR